MRFWGSVLRVGVFVKIADFFVCRCFLIVGIGFLNGFSGLAVGIFDAFLFPRRYWTMKFNRKLVTGLFGLALIAAPITAAAKDNDSGRNNSHQEQAQPAHSNDSHAEGRHQEQASHNEVREQRAAQPQVREQPRMEHQAARVETRPENRNEFRAETRHENQNVVREQNREQNVVREQRSEPLGVNENRAQREAAREYNGREYNRAEHRDAREDRRENNWNRERHEGGDRDGHWIYGDRGRDYDLAYDPDYDREYESGWVMPYRYSGGACAWARHLRNVYNHDRYTGHPAAAESLVWQMHRAERACGGARYGYNSYRYPY